MAKGVQTFGEAYNRFGPWSHGRPRMVNLRPSSGEACADGVPAKATAVDKPASAPNPCGTRRRSACGSGYRDAAGATRKSIVDARDIRAVWEKHMAFESIRTLFFSLTKSIATTTSYESSTEVPPHSANNDEEHTKRARSFFSSFSSEGLPQEADAEGEQGNLSASASG